MAGRKSSGGASPGRERARRASEEAPSELENALSILQCVLVARRHRYTPEAVSWAQYDVLELLRLHGAMTPSALSERLGVSRPTLSKSMRVLKDLGLVVQTQASEDRREQSTALTERGLNFLERAAIQRRRAATLVGAALTLGEQAIFAELCRRASAALQSETDGGGGAA
ncbi:MarR family transcriptional regulator [Labilithrix luteola]|uniref:MarR family winged helix-turn-helix transcriptional regulator n=1 Tax=Labilithrix luteola TaxID=1391654 RepID=UPI0011BA57A6